MRRCSRASVRCRVKKMSLRKNMHPVITQPRKLINAIRARTIVMAARICSERRGAGEPATTRPAACAKRTAVACMLQTEEGLLPIASLLFVKSYAASGMSAVRLAAAQEDGPRLPTIPAAREAAFEVLCTMSNSTRPLGWMDRTGFFCPIAYAGIGYRSWLLSAVPPYRVEGGGLMRLPRRVARANRSAPWPSRSERGSMARRARRRRLMFSLLMIPQQVISCLQATADAGLRAADCCTRSRPSRTWCAWTQNRGGRMPHAT